jgi:hypothetical protein
MDFYTKDGRPLQVSGETVYILASAAMIAASCSAPTSEQTQSQVNASEAASTTVSGVLDNAVDGSSETTLFSSDLKLVRSGLNGNHGGSSEPLSLPKPLDRATVGFFDDEAILRQVHPARLIEMMRSDFGFRFVADLDGDHAPETYRTGWFMAPGREPGQFLAVFEERRVKDIWVTEGVEPLSISWRGAKPIVFDCNCPTYAPIVYRNEKLDMKWIEETR